MYVAVQTHVLAILTPVFTLVNVRYSPHAQGGGTCSEIRSFCECEKCTLGARAGKVTCCHGTGDEFGLESNNAYCP